MGNSTEPSTDASVLITTEYGPVEGEARQGHIAALGIPYASPPIGALRFRAPRPSLSSRSADLVRFFVRIAYPNESKRI